MDALFDPTRHEPLAGGTWNEVAARAAIGRIAARCLAECVPAQGWLTHPRDDPDSPDERLWPLYHGAAGVVWALRHLHAERAWLPEDGAGDAGLHVLDGLWPVAAERSRLALGEHRHGTASLLLGETGARLLEWQCGALEERPALAERIAALVAGNARNPCLEPLWGGSGTVLAAIWMAEATRDAEGDASRWAALVRDGAQALFDAMDQSQGLWGWTQDLYGRQVDYLGAGHGLAGNAFPFLRGADWLPPALTADLLDRVLPTLQQLARRGRAPDGRPMVTWGGFRTPPSAQVAARVLMQDCHGAPGIVVRLARAPRTAQWDDLLTAAGETVWQAGPLNKGPGLCHGTAGNGFALLKLWRRTGDALWLDRARAFAMHAIAQVEAAHAEHGRSRASLWTGDPGVACYLWECVQASDRFPTLDHML